MPLYLPMIHASPSITLPVPTGQAWEWAIGVALSSLASQNPRRFRNGLALFHSALGHANQAACVAVLRESSQLWSTLATHLSMSPSCWPSPADSSAEEAHP